MAQQAVVTVSAEYRSGGYSAHQIEELAGALAEIGPTRVKPLYAPAAVEYTLIEFVLSYIGAKLLDVAAREAIKRSVPAFARAVSKLRASKLASEEPEPGLLKVLYSFDDLDVVVFHPSQDDLENMSKTLDLVRERLTAGSLKGLSGVLVEMPLVELRGSWVVPDWGDYLVGGPSTLWAISTAYRELDRAPYDADKDEWLPSGISSESR